MHEESSGNFNIAAWNMMSTGTGKHIPEALKTSYCSGA
jgi:hypothetical protein